MSSTPEVPDARLLAAHDLALAALKEITPEASIGAPAGYVVEADGVVSLKFENALGGYPGWHWTVSVASADGAEPTVLEAELLPGDGALLAPDWVPWAVRLAEYHAQQAAAEAERLAAGEEPAAESDEAADVDDIDDLDAADFDDDGSPILHAGDVDGVDIDALDEDAEPEDDETDDESAEDDEFDEDDEPDGPASDDDAEAAGDR